MAEWIQCDNCGEWTTKIFLWFGMKFCSTCQVKKCKTIDELIERYGKEEDEKNICCGDV